MKKTALLFLSLPFLFIFEALYAQQGTFKNPVIPEDIADPSIIRIGNTYYAAGTSSEWAPFYPFFESNDLINWKQKGHIFQEQPEWTSSSFWAPELYYHQNKLYAYYSARNKKGVSYIGVATAENPDQPFTDHGIIVEVGSEAIDAFVLEDKGELYISWKAYGLDKRPIELVACKLSEDGLRLDGEPFSLLKDDEGIGMEGQHWFKKDDYYYIIYSPKSCCGPKSDYQVYVARSKELKGPYEKYSENPILSGNDDDVLSCGHGTFTTTPDGRMFYLFHAYLTGERFFQGREVMLQEIVVDNDNWIHFTTGNKVSLTQKTPFPNTEQQAIEDFTDDFKTSTLVNKWTWNYPYSTPNIILRKGELHLSGIAKTNQTNTGTALCVRPNSPHYSYETRVVNKNSSFKGLTMYGDAQNLIAFGCKENRLIFKQVTNGKEKILVDIPEPTSNLYLKFEVLKGRYAHLFWSSDGKNWVNAHPSSEYIDLEKLVRWDRVARPGLIHIGKEEEPAVFSHFSLKNL